MMSRRQVLLVLAGALANSGRVAAQAKGHKIGMLGARSQSFFVPGIRRRLAELGYAGAIARIEYKHVDGVVERFPMVAAEMVRAGYDLVFAIGPEQAPRALLDAKLKSPVVFLAIDYDPVEKKIVDSLARPGRNITGLYSLSPQVTLKRLEMVRELLPEARQVLVLADRYSRDHLPAIRKAAAERQMQVTIVEFAGPPYDYREAFARGRKEAAEAVLILTSPVFGDDRARIHDMALEQRLPSVGFASPEGYFVVSYNADIRKMSYRVAEIGVQVLRGTKAGDIPVQQADEFEIAVNLKAVRVLGIKLPSAVLARATKVVE